MQFVYNVIACEYRFIFITQYILSLSLLIDTPNLGLINILLSKMLCRFIVIILDRCASAKMYSVPSTQINIVLA
jgi:hypothetical protein